MQKVKGSSPFIRSKESPAKAGFSVDTEPFAIDRRGPIVSF
jgi:hypothetical protein